MTKKIVCALLVLSMVIGTFGFNLTDVSADSSVSWNFSDTSFRSLGTVSANTTINNLTLNATSSKTMTVSSSSQTLNGTTYNYCLALGGGGSSSYRSVSFKVSGINTIKVTAKSSGSSTRTLLIVNGSGDQVGSISCTSSLATQSVSVTGTGTLYIYSSGSGINIYKIQVDTKDDSGSSGTGSGTSTGTVSNTINGDGYPDQLMTFVNTGNSYFVNANGTSANSSVGYSSTSSTSNRWKLVKKGSDYYQIVNAASGYVLAPSGNVASSGKAVVVTSSASNTAQYWKIAGVTTDCNSNNMNYKIVNYANTSLALTLSGSSYVLSSYSGSSSQTFRVNTYGVEGFAGYCTNISGKKKACITGGVFGSVVYVTSASQLATYCAGSTAYTIVINGNISASSLTKITVGSNKTIVGSFSNHTVNNIHFRLMSGNENVIFKNITLKHDADKNENDDIQIYITNGNDYWVDHCTFSGHSSTTSSDVDKHLYIGAYADYCTVSACVFMGHKYGLILGYPQDDGLGTYNGYPQMTICNNYFYNVLTRAPGLMRYGYFHSYNNFVYGFNLGYTPYTGCNIYSEKNYFDKGSYSGNVVDDKGVGGFTDSGSVLSSSISSLATGATSWRPSSNYSYATRTAASGKSWCQSHCGSQSSSLVYAIG